MKHIYIIALCLLTYFSFEEQLNAQAGRVTGSSTDSTSTIYTGSDSLNQAGLTHVKFADDYSQGLIFGSYGGTTFNTNSYDNIGLFADIYNNYRVGMAYGDGLDEANIWIQPYILSENIKESDTGNYYRSNKQVNSVNTGIKFGNKVYTHIERFNEDQTSIHGGSINDQLRYGGTNGGQMVANFEDHDDYHWLVQRGYGASAKNLFRVTLDTTGSDNDSIFIFDKYALPNAVPTSDGSAYAIHWTNGIPTFAAAGGGGGDGNGLLTASNDDGVIPSGMDLDIADTLTFNKTNSDPALSILGSTGALSFNEYGTGIFGTGAEVTRMFGIDATGSLLDNAALYQFVGSGTASGIVAHSTAAAGFDNPTNSQFIANGQGVLAFSSPKVGLGSYTFAANGAVIGGIYGFVTNISGTTMQLDFQVGPTPATNTALQLETDLDVVLPGYAAGAKDGTATKSVGVDVTGKMVTFDAVGGADGDGLFTVGNNDSDIAVTNVNITSELTFDESTEGQGIVMNPSLTLLDSLLFSSSSNKIVSEGQLVIESNSGGSSKGRMVLPSLSAVPTQFRDISGVDDAIYSGISFSFDSPSNITTAPTTGFLFDIPQAVLTVDADTTKFSDIPNQPWVRNNNWVATFDVDGNMEPSIKGLYSDTSLIVTNDDLLSITTFPDHELFTIHSTVTTGSSSDNDIVLPTLTAAMVNRRFVIVSDDTDTDATSGDNDTAVASASAIISNGKAISGYIMAAGEVATFLVVNDNGTYQYHLTSSVVATNIRQTITAASQTIHLERGMLLLLDATTQGATTNTLATSDLEDGDMLQIIILGADSGTSTLDLDIGNIVWDTLAGSATEAFSGARHSFTGTWDDVNDLLILNGN